MLGTLKGRFIVLLLVLGASGWYLYSNGLTLGLDLQGGMHLALEVDDRERALTPEARADATDRALQIIRTRIDEFGVEEPLIQKVGSDRIIVELPGIREEARAKDVIQRTAFLQFQLVKSEREVVDALPRIDRAIVQALGPELESVMTVPEEPRESVQDLLFQRPQDTAAVAEGEGEAEDTGAGTATEQRPLTSLLMTAGGLGMFQVAEEDVPVVNRFIELPEVQRLLPRGTVLRWGATPEGRGAQLYRALYVLEQRPFMTGEHLENAVAGRDPQTHETIVSFELNRRGGRIFEQVTGEHIGDYIAIVLDNQVVSAPQVRGRIGMQGQIQMGAAPLSEAQDLALVLRAGALPAPLHVVEERTVGPTLGADSIEQGKVAGIIGVLLVIGIMVGYYRMAGLLAVGSLVVYVVIVAGGLAALNAKLTAPGIAGFILSIGMAVDANVLIFERIREELAEGRSVRAAVDSGFQNAMSAIVDSNLTTLITGLILFQVGTGPVRGFAVTLSIGIIASFFSAVFVTRTLFLAYLQRKRALEAISI